MANVRPELIFVAGPQQGQRVVLAKNVAVLGRSASCDLVLTEQSISRQHIRLSISQHGWIVENLSAAGTRINGKKYKEGKTVLVETGDRLGAGVDTEILFVAPGDDAEAALEAYRAANVPKAPVAPAAPAAGEPPKAKPPAAGRAPQGPPGATAAGAGLSKDEQARRAKTRKYAIYGGVWLACMGLLFGGLVIYSNYHDQGGGGGPRINELFGGAKDMDTALSAIAQAIRDPIVRDAHNSTKAAEAARISEVTYENGFKKIGEIQKCVKNFKLYLAYSKKSDFDTPQQGEKFRKAQDKLIAEVQDYYKKGWICEEEGRWAEADTTWTTLLLVIPLYSEDEEWDSSGYKALVQNVINHDSLAKQNMQKKKSRY